jgi:thioesterase domain-containing protein
MKQKLEAYLHTHIPLSGKMEMCVMEASRECVRLSAPLGPNINHRESVFGGSLSALAILSAWSYLHVCLEREGRKCRLVIQRNTMAYEEPGLGTFEATVQAVDDADWKRFTRTIDKMGKARLTLNSLLTANEVTLGRFEGQFVAIRLD